MHTLAQRGRQRTGGTLRAPISFSLLCFLNKWSLFIPPAASPKVLYLSIPQKLQEQGMDLGLSAEPAPPATLTGPFFSYLHHPLWSRLLNTKQEYSTAQCQRAIT